LKQLPNYYKHLLYIACSASFGIKGVGSAVKFFQKKKWNQKILISGGSFHDC